MKKLIYTVVCMMLFCCACSDADLSLIHISEPTRH